MTQPLLDLDTLIVRQGILIDGVRYEIMSPDELSVLDSHRFSIWGRRIEDLSKLPEPSTDELSELEELYELVSRAVFVDIPDAVFAKLSGTQKVQVVDVFIVLLLRSKLGAAGAMATAMGTNLANLWNGERPSRASSGSSAGHLAGGLWKRLRRWFGRI